jgi:hypothetical protein
MNEPLSAGVQAPKKRVKPLSRPKRWQEASSNCLAAFAKIREGLDELEAATSELKSVQEEYEEWRDGQPENLQQSPLGEKLEAVCEIDIESIHQTVSDAVDEAEGVAEEADGIDLPQGFGRD